MALYGERQISVVHAASVVDHADELAAAFFNRDVDTSRAGVERVFNKLLHRRSGPFDHFAGGDAIDKDGIEAADGQAGNPRTSRRGRRSLQEIRDAILPFGATSEMTNEFHSDRAAAPA
jgi:hypothetical protein